MNKEVLVVPFAFILLHASMSAAQSSGNQSLPLCVSGMSDSDGDGYGWENEQSCIVAGSAAAGICEDRGDFPWGWNESTQSSCILGVQTEPSACVDADGDGWGWNGIATCIVDSLQCEDRGGYPWGWNPVTLSSCRLDETRLQPSPAGCTDTDGDGSLALNIIDDTGATDGIGAVSIDGITYLTSASPDTGSEFSAYNPDTSELTILGDIFPGSVSSGPSEFTVVDGKVYFTARDLMTVRDFWVYDPATREAPQSLSLFSERAPGIFFTPPSNLTALDGKLYFTSDEFGVGLELAMYDPQTGVVGTVTDIFEGEPGSQPDSLTVVGNKLYFSANDGINGRELWVYDPATDDSTMVADLSTNINGGSPGPLYVIDDKIYFNTRSGGQTRVYDTLSGARPTLIDYNLIDNSLNEQQPNGEIIGTAAGLLILHFDDEARGNEPWVYDPVTGTTTLMADINPGPEGSRSFSFVGLDGEIYFRAEDTFGDFKLWVYNPATMQLRRFIEPGLGFPSELAVAEERLYFSSGSVGPADRKTWVYDSRCD